MIIYMRVQPTWRCNLILLRTCLPDVFTEPGRVWKSQFKCTLNTFIFYWFANLIVYFQSIIQVYIITSIHLSAGFIYYKILKISYILPLTWYSKFKKCVWGENYSGQTKMTLFCSEILSHTRVEALSFSQLKGNRMMWKAI